MFRDTVRHELSPKYFGVGSRISAGHKEYLLVEWDSKSVVAIDLATFKVLHQSVTVVVDSNWLSESEARKLVSLIEPGYTFTDFEFDTKGLKELV